MNLKYTFLISLVTGLSAIIATLGGQLIIARSNLKAKRLELVYARKADTYKSLMEKAGAFANDISSQEKYAEFIHAYYSTIIIASQPVLDTFAAQGNITRIASHLLAGQHDSENQKLMKDSWLVTMNALAEAMRQDLQGFSKH